MLVHSVTGSGPTVVLLHSGGMSGRQFGKLAALLESSYRVVAPDLIGSGGNPPWPDGQPFHFHQDVGAVVELIDAIAGPAPAPVHLVGHSYGGLLALTLARLHPGRVRSLALYDPVVFGVLQADGDTPADATGLADLPTAPLQDDAGGGGEAWFDAFVGYWNGPGAWAALPEKSRQAFLRVGRKVYLEVASLMADRTPASAYAGLQVPSLLMTGERTPVAARRVVARLASVLPRSRVEVIGGAGHMGPITHATTVNPLIADHLRVAG
jgi:pimeloyl-ACP methyl ester carboxylesterase